MTTTSSARATTNDRSVAGDSSPLRAAWDRYHSTFDQLRADIQASEQFEFAPEQRSRAYHGLLELQALMYNLALAPRQEQPRIYHNTIWQADAYSIGGNGPDFHYGATFLDGRRTYRLFGNLRDSEMVLTQVMTSLPGSPGHRLLGNYDFADFDVAADGSFEAIVSAERQDGNWVELDPESTYHWVFLRPTVQGWDDVPADIRIERIDSIPKDFYEKEDFDEAATATRIDAATAYARFFVDELSVGFDRKLRQAAGGVNALASMNHEDVGDGGSPTADYVLGCFEVDDDEALILELEEEPNGAYWSFMLMDVWCRTIDFRTRHSALNGTQISVDADGGVRIVVSKRDPGVANWLDTQGYRRGQLVMRNYRATKSIVPTVHRVEFDQLDEHLPESTTRVGSAEREELLVRRRESYRRRHGE